MGLIHRVCLIHFEHSFGRGNQSAWVDPEGSSGVTM